MTPTLSPQQREEVLEAMARNLHHARNKARWPHLEVEDWKTVSHLEKRYYRDLAAQALDAALPAIIAAVLGGPFAARFVIDYMERETGVPFGDMIGRDDKDRIRALAEEAR